MNEDHRIDADLRALGEETRRDLPGLDHTARALRAADARRKGGHRMRIARRVAVGAVVAAALLFFPFPYSRVVGYDLAIRGADGRTTTVRVPTRDAKRAERRAERLRRRGAEVTVTARRERAWGSVYAMAQEKLFSVDVDTTGKRDDQIEAEIREQLVAAGWTPTEIDVTRDADGTRATVGADDGAGRVIKVVRKGAPDGRIEMHEPSLDTTRDPGMTDAELRDKIVKQLEANGLSADVTVEGDKIQIRAQRQQ